MSRVVAWFRRFVRELRRRRVIRVSVVYAGTAFVILQLAEILVEPFGLPSWTLRLITLVLVLGFPLAVGLAWVFDVTEEGLVRTGAGGDDELSSDGKPFTSNSVIIGLLAVAIGLLLYPRLTGPPDSASPQGAGGKTAARKDTASRARLGPRSVAVLPFTYLAAEDSTDYFSIGMTDELITRLSQVEGLPVVARTSVMQYRGTKKTIPQIGNELGVAHVVEGSVQKVGGKVRIQAQLIDARTGKHLWAEGFTRPFQDVLSLQVDLARRIAEDLKTTLLPETKRQMASAARVDSAAYTLYLQARKLRFQETPRSLAKAFRLLRRSVSIDPTFAPAWALLSYCAWYPPAASAIPEKIDRDSLAHAAAQQALTLDSTSAEVQVAVGLLKESLDLNFPAAGPHFKRAVELSPGLANAHRELGLYLMRMSRFETAERYLQKAARLDPASAVAFKALGQNDLYWGNYEQAQRHLRKALALQPRLYLARLFLGLALLGQDSTEAAVSQMRRAAERRRTPGTLAHLGWAYAQAGQRDSTRAHLARFQEAFGSATPAAPFQEAVLHMGLQNPDRALGRLEQAGVGAIYLKVAPYFEPLHGTPRFQRLLKEMGLDDEAVQRTMKKLDLEPPSFR